jgi:hypothetical protein
MENFDIKENFDSKIKSLWERYLVEENHDLSEFLERGYCVPQSIKMNSIIMIGINPAFGKDALSDNLDNYYQDNHNEVNERMIPYFQKMKDLLGVLSWSHLDLVYIRETNQNKIVNLLKTHSGKDFIYQNLMISKEIIEEIQPKIIVVANALARQFLGFKESGWMDFKFEFDDEIGTYKVVGNPKLENTTIFFSSMLSGQRALDVGSFERLKWHINKINNIK